MDKMRPIVVIGAGYVGLPTAAAVAAGILGRHGPRRVILVDRDAARLAEIIETRDGGGDPLGEPGLGDLLRDLCGSDGGCISWLEFEVASSPESLADLLDTVEPDAVVITVGTPMLPNWLLDMSAVVETAIVAAGSRRKPLVIIRSTCDPDQVEDLADEVEAAGARLVVMPEFLREGNAVHDSKYPSRVVVGSRTAEARKAAMDLLAAGPTSGLLGMISDAFSERVSGPKVFEMGPGEAAVVKLASNAVLALHVAVGGAVASWVGSTPGGDAAAVLRAIDADPRVGRIGRPGLGAAGPCLPKDAGQASRTLGLPIRDLVRSHQEQVIRHLARRIYNSNCSRVVISGVGFKPDSKDWRSSPVEDLVRAMIARGVSPASIEVIDSRLTASELARVREEWMRSVTYSNAAGCDVTGAAVVLCGAPLIDPEGNPAVVFDPYVLMAAEAVSIWRQRGTRYIGGGRGECWGLPKAKAGAA